MLHSLTYFCCVFAVAYAGVRIVNGADAEEGEFPYAVSLQLLGSHVCGGTILNDRFILTAAHCFECRNTTSLQHRPYLFSIQYDLLTITNKPINTIPVKKINIHASYNIETVTYDVAVLELETPIPAGKWKPVNITKSFSTEKTQNGVIIGWGQIYQDGPISENLQKLEVNVYDDETCLNSGKDIQNHICVGKDWIGGGCPGDSGTALIVDGIQAGITSHGYTICGIYTYKFPDVYSRVSTYYDWIKEISG